MNATLTTDQLKALAAAKGEGIRLTDPLAKQDYILIKAEVYERLVFAPGTDPVS